MDDAVDEQRRRSVHLVRRDSAVDVALDSREHGGALPVPVEPLDVEAQLACVPPQVVLLERLLPMEEQLVHLPVAILQGGRLGGARRSHRVRVDVSQRKVPEGEANATSEAVLELLDL